MENLIQAIQNQIVAKVQTLKEVDEDWGQMDFYDGMPPVKFPCALIEIQYGQFSDTGEKRQQATLTVVIKLYILRLNNTSNNAPQSQKDNAAKGWQCYNDIVRSLHQQNFIGNGFGAPVRRRMTKIKRRDGVYQRDITFTIGFTDKLCVPDRPTVQPTISIAVAIDQ